MAGAGYRGIGLRRNGSVWHRTVSLANLCQPDGFLPDRGGTRVDGGVWGRPTLIRAGCLFRKVRPLQGAVVLRCAVLFQLEVCVADLGLPTATSSVFLRCAGSHVAERARRHVG